ncbi:MAG: hypothetical protein QW609_04260 [Candidatus Aenigmatarchaeota archaeon]
MALVICSKCKKEIVNEPFWFTPEGKPVCEECREIDEDNMRY